MDGFDLTAARLVRLRQDIDALLPWHDAGTRQEIFRYLSMATREGLDMFPQFRAVIARRPALEAQRADPAPVADHELEIDVLPEQRRVTLWPYRPHRLPDELLSSWLWRVARGIGAPPRRFALDAIGARLADVDRDIDDTAIDRLAFLSGQTREHLLRGTMRPDAGADPGDERGQVQQALLQHGDLALNRYRGGRGRGVPVTQYCPVCLGSEHSAYLRRGWRFSLEVVCSEDGCFLIDACWRCGALLDPLSHAAPCASFVCRGCGAPLAKAPSVRMSETLEDQAAVYGELHRRLRWVTAGLAEFRLEEYIRRLSAGDLRGTNPTNAADRHCAVMLEAWALRHPPAMRPQRPQRTTQGKSGSLAGKKPTRAKPARRPAPG